LADSADSSRTIIITGNAGVGKTSFVYRLAFGKDTATETPRILPIVADYKKALPSRHWTTCVIGFLENAATGLAEHGHPVSGLRDSSVDFLQHNSRVILEHFEAAVRRPNFPRILVFLDDFDYAEDAWFDLLDYFLPFARSVMPSAQRSPG